MTTDIFERFVARAADWDLVALHRELTEAIDSLDEPAPFVPTNLAAALGMFLDSYGPPGIRWSEEPVRDTGGATNRPGDAH